MNELRISRASSIWMRRTGGIVFGMGILNRPSYVLARLNGEELGVALASERWDGAPTVRWMSGGLVVRYCSWS